MNVTFTIKILIWQAILSYFMINPLRSKWVQGVQKNHQFWLNYLKILSYYHLRTRNSNLQFDFFLTPIIMSINLIFRKKDIQDNWVMKSTWREQPVGDIPVYICVCPSWHLCHNPWPKEKRYRYEIWHTHFPRRYLKLLFCCFFRKIYLESL